MVFNVRKLLELTNKTSKAMKLCRIDNYAVDGGPEEV